MFRVAVRDRGVGDFGIRSLVSPALALWHCIRSFLDDFEEHIADHLNANTDHGYCKI